MHSNRCFRCIYTDVSETKEGVGSASTSKDHNAAFKLPHITTAYTGELYAVWKAMEYSNTRKIKRFIIITDSLSTPNALPEMYLTHPILISIKHELWKAYGNGITRKLMGVPSHTGIRGNERADCLARAAIYGDAPTTTTVIHPDIKSFLKNIQSKACQAEWDITDTKLSEVKKSILPHKITPKKRRHQVMLTRLQLGP
ncbi:hypothetical protein JTB14_018937 [Gonioctena quinquepunctata]|nr:hypothetical protein JTB14_018937 [Gonioctena quinquepunctata]